MNGRPLSNGKYTAFRRMSSSSDIRSNMSAGSKAMQVQVTDEMPNLVEVVRPRLVSDGMFLVGLDIVGDKLMEVNVFSPGGLGSCAQLCGENCSAAIIEDLERKVSIASRWPNRMTNLDLAALWS